MEWVLEILGFDKVLLYCCTSQILGTALAPPKGLELVVNSQTTKPTVGTAREAVAKVQTASCGIFETDACANFDSCLG